MSDVVITAFDLVTAYGLGTDCVWKGLASNRSAIGPARRTGQARFEAAPTAECAHLDPQSRDTAVWQLCRSLFDSTVVREQSPAEDFFLSTTVGEIELLERSLVDGSDAAESSLANLCLKIERYLGLQAGRGTVVSAACASGSYALALAASRIRQGLSASAMIVACDSVSEFVLAGFNSLMAMDKQGARPFDSARQGLSLGDGAAVMVLMNADLARERNIPVLADVAGWGMSDDANHITGPSRDGAGLAQAIQGALTTAGIAARDISFISAHGTGTLYNDAMEMQAFKKIFSAPVPIYGLKGAIGHTLGAAGLIEAGMAAQALRRRSIPPTVGLSSPDPEAAGWVSAAPRVVSSDHALCVNAGFGGINAAVILKRRD
ncbi:MAG: beta-ketoacyl-[acyl-carrier-protein] synthase family protein [Candidatus Omnitrophica bacterium]|nr:beta-ketoacyl-[acyl-carrier-protein] synthase family protein [Candidatus Omnitrophota bacterium]